MKEITWQLRNDYTADMECELCGHVQADRRGYFDANYARNVIPAMPCKACGRCSNDAEQVAEVGSE